MLVIGVAEVLGDTGRVLVERLRELVSWPARFRALDAFLLERLSQAAPVRADIEWAWGRLVDAGGDVRIGPLVTELGCSRRHISRRFNEEIGLAPKAYARVLRFEHAMGGWSPVMRRATSRSRAGREFLGVASVPPSVAEQAP